MSEGTSTSNGSAVKRVVGYGLVYAAITMALGLWITFTFGSDKRGVAGFVYVFHAAFYSACLGALLGVMFHAADDH